MKKETIIFITCLAILALFLMVAFTSVANAEINLDQCTINNNLEVCNQTIDKLEDQKIVKVVEVKKEKELTLKDFIVELVNIVKERKTVNDVVITSYFEDESSILVENKNDIKCVNNLCGLEKEWR